MSIPITPWSAFFITLYTQAMLQARFSIALPKVTTEDDLNKGESSSKEENEDKFI